MLELITPGDVAKDGFFMALGFSPAAILPYMDTALLLGLLNLTVVIVFRVIELRVKYGKKTKSEEENQ